MSQHPPTALLQSGDLIDDRAVESIDQDKFRAGDVVAEIAELARSTRTPANIVLFGAWGSGKTSVKNLLQLELKDSRKQANKKVRFAAVDAFKFAEVPLRRSFITQVVGELGLDKRAYKKKLYERSSHVDLKIDGAGVVRLALTFVGFFALYSALVSACLGVAAWLGPGGWVHQFRAHVVALTLSALAGSTLVTGLFSFIGETFTRDVFEENPSSEEQFEEVFAEVVRERINVGKDERLIVFIDELDRASSRQVASVLETLRTFLELPGCVFIVAADQHVLERALRESARQTTPVDVANPYYSSGSAYLDKIFQYQIQLPPVLPRRLWSFAQDLVRDRGGLWGELSDCSEVVSVLIPTHVQSKRRVKTLLNNFALAYRLVEQRQAAGEVNTLQSRAAELAKLVCLRTEFPLFADDLLLDARMPAVVLACFRRESLSAFPGLSQVVAERAGLYASGKAAVDDVVVRAEAGTSNAPSSEEQEVEEVKKAHTQQLLRYLMRTEKITDPRRDLVFGGGAGSMFGLPPELTDALELSALDGQADQVVDQLSRLDPDLQRSSLLFLARLLDEYNSDTVSAENVVATLLAGAASDDISVDTSTADAVIRTFATYGPAGSLSADQLPFALALAVAATPATPGRDALLRSVFADEEAVRATDLGFDILRGADKLVTEFSDDLGYVFAVRILDGEAAGVSEAMSDVSEAAVARVVAASHDTLREEIGTHELAVKAAEGQTPPDTAAADAERAEAAEVPENLAAFLDLAHMAGRRDVTVVAAKTLLRLSTAEARNVFQRRIDALAPVVDSELADAMLAAVVRRKAETWVPWLAAISEQAASRVRRLKERLGALVTKFWTPEQAVTSSEAWQRDTVGELGRLATAGGLQLDRIISLSAARSEPAIPDEDAANTRLNEFALLRIAADSGAVSQRSSADAIIDNLAVMIGDEDTDSDAGKPVLNDALRSVSAASDETLQELIAAIAEPSWITDGDLARAKLLIAGALRRRNSSYECPVELAAIVDLARTGGGDGAVRGWFESFDPPVADAWTVVTAWRPSRHEDRSAVEDYVTRQTMEARTELARTGITAFVRGQVSDGVFALLHLRDADAAALARDLITLLRALEANPERDRVLRVWVALGSVPIETQRQLASQVFRPMLNLNKGAAESAFREASLVEGVAGGVGRDIARDIVAAGERWGIEKKAARALDRAGLPEPRRRRRGEQQEESSVPPKSSDSSSPDPANEQAFPEQRDDTTSGSVGG